MTIIIPSQSSIECANFYIISQILPSLAKARLVENSKMLENVRNYENYEILGIVRFGKNCKNCKNL